MTGEHPLERAFDLARSGECQKLVELERRLRQEGFLGVMQHLSAPTLRKQLLTIMKGAQTPADLMGDQLYPEQRLGLV